MSKVKYLVYAGGSFAKNAFETLERSGYEVYATANRSRTVQEATNAMSGDKIIVVNEVNGRAIDQLALVIKGCNPDSFTKAYISLNTASTDDFEAGLKTACDAAEMHCLYGSHHEFMGYNLGGLGNVP